MSPKKVLVPALSATTVMTLFSYLVSGPEGKDFSEPHLLGELEKSLQPGATKKIALPAGWVTHYSIGVLFTILFQYTWKHTSIKPSLKSGLAFGVLGGTWGVLTWKTLFKIHPHPPAIHNTKFYSQLFIAHLIFAIAVVMTEKAVR